MNPGQNPADISNINHASGAAVGYIFGSLIFIVLVVIVKLSATVPAIDANRAATISSALYDIRTNEIASLDTPAWIDRSRGIVRLPIATAEQLAAHEWSNPAQARADLIARAQRATAPVKPAANPFE
ncbi:MAG TPA: hypothetical protein VMF08_18120 [Candidatus Sulfotelmatobacter sp.]|nr:hypothetical protein [Candidatus Sulfotelmatobacter sp.]